MTPPIKVSYKEIKDWVHSQPDDRPVNMGQPWYYDSCGCLMVQYGKEKFPDIKFDSVGLLSWSSFNRGGYVVKHAVMDISISKILGENWYRPTTFGELKALLSP